MDYTDFLPNFLFSIVLSSILYSLELPLLSVTKEECFILLEQFSSIQKTKSAILMEYSRLQITNLSFLLYICFWPILERHFNTIPKPHIGTEKWC